MLDKNNQYAKIKFKIDTEVMRHLFEGTLVRDADRIPIDIVPSHRVPSRCCIYKERAVVRYRIMALAGYTLETDDDEYRTLSSYMEEAMEEDKPKLPLFTTIAVGCSSCPKSKYQVSDACRSCFARPCSTNCPKDAIEYVGGKAHINEDKCIKCGKCAKACSYNAIIHLERPCQASCGMDAIGVDNNGKAVINQDKCVACGQCLVSCPFGAIVDKGQIFQVIQSILKGDQVIAILAPAFIGQFTQLVSPGKLVTGMKMLGFDQVVEVAIGADMCTIEEARDFLEKVPEEQNYMATSCCPAWHEMIYKLFPSETGKISMTLTPMVFTARLMKKEHPGCKVVFVGPCAAKKLEAIREDIRSDVDFVLTFEELMGMFEAKEVDFSSIPESDLLNLGTAAGRGFAVSGGVAGAVTNLIQQQYPGTQVQTARAEGLRECRKLMTMARAGKLNGYLIEGMACPGGCVAGAGTILPIEKAQKFVEKYAAEARTASPLESPYRDVGKGLGD